MRYVYFLIFFITISNNFLFGYYDDIDEDEDVFEPLCDIDFDGDSDCDKFISFASTNWHQNDYRGCIDQYKTALYCDCAEGNELQIYKYMGRAFVEIGILDSAHWSFERGLRYAPDDQSLLEVAAWNAGKLKKFEDQMYYLDRLLEINPENTKALERMSDTYKNNDMYEEQINILNLWLKVDNNNKKALSEKKMAYNKLGIDESSIDKEKLNQFGKQLAMHIAASSPLSIDKDGLDQQIIEKEKEIIREELKNTGKEDKIIDKIAIGKLNKFISENTLLNQEWIMEPKKKVKDIIKTLAVKEKIVVKKFVRFKVGEGV